MFSDGDQVQGGGKIDLSHAGKRQELLERLVRAMAAPRRVPQYRNMPLVDGRKRTPIRQQFDGGVPLYARHPAPYLGEG